MWIAKPIQSLNESEKEAWTTIEQKTPIAQSLCWARAIEAVGGRAFVVFSPDEKVGGIVFSKHTPHSSKTTFECINGPYLDWDNPTKIARQFATFAMAASKISHSFDSLIIKPRWSSEEFTSRLRLLPVSATHQDQAATLVIPIQNSKETQFSKLSSRLRRTLSHTWNYQVETCCQKVTPELLKEFVPQMIQFGIKQGFTVPPLCWFESLITHSSSTMSFWLISAQTRSEALTQIMLCLKGSYAYYLFGYDQRSTKIKASISTSAVAHWEALLLCMKNQIISYDLNGYLIDAQPDHPYYGVCKFKEQFAGELVKYHSPEFIIE